MGEEDDSASRLAHCLSFLFFWTAEWQWHKKCFWSQVPGSTPGCKNSISAGMGLQGIFYFFSCGWRFSQLGWPGLAVWAARQSGNNFFSLFFLPFLVSFMKKQTLALKGQFTQKSDVCRFLEYEVLFFPLHYFWRVLPGFGDMSCIDFYLLLIILQLNCT